MKGDTVSSESGPLVSIELDPCEVAILTWLRGEVLGTAVLDVTLTGG